MSRREGGLPEVPAAALAMACSRRAIGGASAWCRGLFQPAPPRARRCCRSCPRERRRARAATSRPAHDAGDGRAAFVLDVVPGVASATLTTTGAAEQVAPNVLSVSHWDRILQGELYATTSRIDWRTLLKRTFDVDLRVCVRCGGKLTVRAVFTDPASVAKLLGALRSPRAPPTAA